MINALSIRHHEFILAEFTVRGTSAAELLIIHNERGVFLQRKYCGTWFHVCRFCGKLVEKDSYECSDCFGKAVLEALAVKGSGGVK